MTDFNPDDYILGLGAPVEYVTIFESPQLAGELNRIRNQVELLRDDTGEESIGGDSEIASLEEEYEAVYERLAESKKVYQVKGLTSEEVDELSKVAREACKEEADAQATVGRKWGKEQAVREGVKDTREINELVRKHAREMSAAVIQREIGYHTLAKALVEPQLTVEEVKGLYDKIGEKQIHRLMEAFYTASSEDPGSLPKSLRRGRKDAEETL